MTPEEQRIALAEWAGARVISKVFYDYGGARAEKWAWGGDENTPCAHPSGGLWGFGWNRKAGISELPDYLNDLNAVHELEEKLDFEQAEQFEDELCDLVVKYNEQQENPAPWRFAVAHATAAQRCEALLKTLNLWKP